MKPLTGLSFIALTSTATSALVASRFMSSTTALPPARRTR